MNWASVLSRLAQGQDLSYDEAHEAMRVIMSGEASSARLAAFLMGLKAKGVRVEELGAMADAMLAFARPIQLAGPVLDIVGTGGDMAHTVNISTMAALVGGGAGVKIAKHGNRASSSSTGTADVLEELGVNLELEPSILMELSDRAPMTFLFAQVFHPAMKHAAVTRKELGIPTPFNFLGPLTNPAQPQAAAIGCADASMAPIMAGVFAERRTDAAVFRGRDGLDELTIAGPSDVWWVFDGEVERVTLQPEDVELSPAGLDALRGGDRVHNAQVIRDVLAGAAGPIRDAVLLNAGVALALVEQHRTGARFGGLGTAAEALALGVQRAASAIDTGAASEMLARWINLTSRVSSEEIS